MQVLVSLPKVIPDTYEIPAECPYDDCHGCSFELLQEVAKSIRDTLIDRIDARRYRCKECGRSFRVYPVGVTRDQFSERTKGLAALLYVLGMSYGDIELALEALGSPMSRAAICRTVRSAQQSAPGLQRNGVRLQVIDVLAAISRLDGIQIQSSLKAGDIRMYAIDGAGLTLEVPEDSKDASFVDWISTVTEAVGADVEFSSVSPDVDTPANGGDFCRNVLAGRRRSTVIEVWLTALRPQLARDADGSLGALGVSPAQALEDCDSLLGVLRWWPVVGRTRDILYSIRQRYLGADWAQLDVEQHKPSLAYQLCLLTQEHWDMWKELEHAIPSN